MSKVSAVLRFPRSGPGLPVRCWKRHQNLGYAVEPIPVIPKVFVDPAICRQATAENTIIIRLSWGFDEIRGTFTVCVKLARRAFPRRDPDLGISGSTDVVQPVHRLR